MPRERVPISRRDALPHARKYALMPVDRLGKAGARRFEVAEEEEQAQRLETEQEAIDLCTDLLHAVVHLVEVIPALQGAPEQWMQAREAVGASSVWLCVSPLDDVAQPRAAFAEGRHGVELDQRVLAGIEGPHRVRAQHEHLGRLVWCESRST